MKKFLKFSIWLLVVAYTFFIFSNSLMDGETSGALSLKVSEFFIKFFSNYEITISLRLFHSIIRKLAHFVEFYILGVLIAIAIYTCPLFKSRLLNFIIFLLLIPATDELIQYFIPDRVSTYKDMLIDASGMLLGGFSIYVLDLIIKDLFFKKQVNN